MADFEKWLVEEDKKEMLIPTQNSTHLDSKFLQYSALLYEIKQVHTRLEKSLKNIPIGIALKYWLNTKSHQTNREKYSNQILQLIEKKILLITNEQNHLYTLGHLIEKGEQEHKKIIEEIRCIQEWPTSIKEELVQCYIEFSTHLNQNTFGIISLSHDPDQLYALQKALNYSDFIKFLQQLSLRDALIAKLLYFGAPTVEDVLRLTYGQLDLKTCTVKFPKCIVQYPKYLLLDLLHFKEKKKKNDLIFINYKGNQIVRTHLNQSFGRASKGINPRITPRDLLKLKIN